MISTRKGYDVAIIPVRTAEAVVSVVDRMKIDTSVRWLQQHSHQHSHFLCRLSQFASSNSSCPMQRWPGFLPPVKIRKAILLR
jgi:hypothetical protein